jgi:phosphoheptose isomerase
VNLQHFAIDLRRVLPKARVVLPSEPGQISADANDFSWKSAFSMTLAPFLNSEGVLLIASVSGSSSNLVEVAKKAHKLGTDIFVLTSAYGTNEIPASLADIVIGVPSSNARVVESVHSVVLLNGVIEIIAEMAGDAALR